jgi:hypothetical protein
MHKISYMATCLEVCRGGTRCPNVGLSIGRWASLPNPVKLRLDCFCGQIVADQVAGDSRGRTLMVVPERVTEMEGDWAGVPRCSAITRVATAAALTCAWKMCTLWAAFHNLESSECCALACAERAASQCAPLQCYDRLPSATPHA